MKEDFIRQFGQVSHSNEEAIIVLPDIFINTDYAIATAEEFTKQFKRPVFMLDYFYQLTGQSNAFSSADSARPFELMQRMTGEDYVDIFQQCLKVIKGNYPVIKTLTVIGFCFGGRLAYLSGLAPMVKNIVSFYGAGANKPDYYQGKSPIEALSATHGGDSQLRVISFYGTEDSTIPDTDRELTKKCLEEAKISYQAREYPAGHAYFQAGRDSYNVSAAQKSWNDLKEFI